MNFLYILHYTVLRTWVPAEVSVGLIQLLFRLTGWQIIFLLLFYFFELTPLALLNHHPSVFRN